MDWNRENFRAIIFYNFRRSKEMLQKYERVASKHVYHIVTGDDLLIYAYEPESKQQSIV